MAETKECDHAVGIDKYMGCVIRNSFLDEYWDNSKDFNFCPDCGAKLSED